MTDVEEILKWSEERATEIIGETKPIRDELHVGRPNSSEESTTRGTLEALGVILESIPAKPC